MPKGFFWFVWFFFRGGEVGSGSHGVVLENYMEFSNFHHGKVQGQHSNIRMT